MEEKKMTMEKTTEDAKEMIRIGDVLYDYVPSREDRKHLIKTRDMFVQFVESLGYDYSYTIKDNLEEIIVTFCLNSNYRERRSIEFSFVCLLDEVYFEAKFKTPRLHDGIGGEESLAVDLFMEFHTDEMGVYRDDDDRESDDYIKWTVNIYPYESEVSLQMMSNAYNRLVKASTYIIRKMESAYWENYSMSNLSPDKMWSGHGENNWPYSFEVYDGVTNTGKRAFFIESECGEVFIDKHDSLQNKVYIGHYYYFPVGPDEEIEDVRETYEIEVDEDEEMFLIMDTTKSDKPRTRVIGEGGKVTGTDFLYCKFKEHDDCYSTCIIEKNQDETIQFFAIEENGEIIEIARIEKLDQIKPYKDINETQMNANYKVSARFNSGEKIAFIYAIAFLAI